MKKKMEVYTIDILEIKRLARNIETDRDFVVRAGDYANNQVKEIIDMTNRLLELANI